MRESDTPIPIVTVYLPHLSPPPLNLNVSNGCLAELQIHRSDGGSDSFLGTKCSVLGSKSEALHFFGVRLRETEKLLCFGPFQPYGVEHTIAGKLIAPCLVVGSTTTFKMHGTLTLLSSELVLEESETPSAK